MNQLFNVFEILGTIAFAISGATLAIRKDMDLLGIVALGMVTAVGGGVCRDVIGNKSPAIFNSPNILWIAFITTLMTFFIFDLGIDLEESKAYYWIFTVSDAIGLAVFTIFGCQKMLTSYNFGTIVFFGVLTGVGGGIIRDVLAGQTPYVLTKHFYACSCILGALVYVILWPSHKILAIFIGMAVVFVSRVLAVIFKWNLPKVSKGKRYGN